VQQGGHVPGADPHHFAGPNVLKAAEQHEPERSPLGPAQEPARIYAVGNARRRWAIWGAAVPGGQLLTSPEGRLCQPMTCIGFAAPPRREERALIDDDVADDVLR
jgi:hypothetical protein